MTTIFEKLLSGELPCAKVYEDELVFAFMDAGQVNDGHVIVASKKPYETILDIDEETTQRLFLVAKRIAHVVQDVFKAEGITLLQANKDAGWQSVPHIHVHVLPRYKNDGVELVWPRKEPGIERLKELAKLIQVPRLWKIQQWTVRAAKVAMKHAAEDFMMAKNRLAMPKSWCAHVTVPLF